MQEITGKHCLAAGRALKKVMWLKDSYTCCHFDKIDKNHSRNIIMVAKDLLHNITKTSSIKVYIYNDNSCKILYKQY